VRRVRGWTDPEGNTGAFRKDLEVVLEPARTAMREATNLNPMAKIQYMYPDGVDHVHVEALPS
jgi:hypothetical protein